MPRRSRSSTGSAATSPKRTRRSAPPTDNRALRDAALGGGDQPGRRINVTDAEVNDKNAALKPISETEGTEIVPRELELHVDENRKAHHTDDFEQEDLIVRRGQEFSISVTFSRKYNRKADDVIIQLTTGSRPQESKDTLLRLKVSHDQPEGPQDWFAVFKSSEENTVKFGIVPATDAIVGKYGVFVETVTKGDEGQTFSHRREFPDQTFVVLFNAWCKDDSVYMEDEKEREEYVLADRGRVWAGTRHKNGGMPWNFGQFEDCVLEAALYILDQAELSYGARSCPIKITRCISSRANSCDNDGVLTGRWTDEYPKESTVPWAWTGSVAILEEFMKTKKSVEFGQCWVFSGLVTTLLRCLGIPTRSVTNFDSAHDNDASITIDYHWNEDDEPLSDLDDSVWNFHVWNEAYFKRSDLPEGYGGWQALDATPQEASEGVMRCGPAPVKAIKEGNVYLPHDAPFIFAEVNGDKVHWLVKKDGSMEVINKEKFAIGQQISTKAVGSNALHDLTWDYKYRDGTPEERIAVHRAFRYSSRREHRVYDLPDPDVTFALTTPDFATLGESFTITVTVTNTTEEKRHVSLRLTAVSSYYTGVPSNRIGTKVFTEELAANQAKTVNLEITPEAYQGYLKPESMVTVYMKGHVIQTKRAYAKTECFEVVKPCLTLEVPDRATIGETFDVVIKFTNPLDQKLTGGVFHLEAARITRPLTLPYKKAIGPRQEVAYTIENLRPTRSGQREIIANFSCDQMSGLTGSAEVYVSYSAR